jgi:hypothetical protein
VTRKTIFRENRSDIPGEIDRSRRPGPRGAEQSDNEKQVKPGQGVSTWHFCRFDQRCTAVIPCLDSPRRL